ncbi:hypothetical protein [uncultured Fibrobacter sp.]|nr:hypothetical protein [uncultured Fibrobacter sp.]
MSRRADAEGVHLFFRGIYFVVEALTYDLYATGFERLVSAP